MESQDQVLSFPLTNVRSRQIFRYDTGHNAIRILYDSLLKPFVGCDLIISETMFAKADTTTVRRSKRELQINFDALDRPFICTAKNIYGELSGITVWTQLDDDSMEKMV